MEPSAVELLLGCLSDRLEPSAVSRQPSAIWGEVVEIAAGHGVAPLLFRRLKESDALALVPADSRERLRLFYFVSAERNARLHRALRSVLQCLCSAGIPVIVLKGAHLAEAVYGEGALRPMCDVDLMVQKADLPRAHSALLDLGGVVGYKSRGTAVGVRHEDIEWLCRRRHHLPPLVVHGLVVEIHWNIVSPTEPVSLDAAGLWSRSQPAKMAGVDVLALAPEDLLLDLCWHATVVHGLEIGLRPFCDIALAIGRFRSRIDWAQVEERAREWGASRSVGLTLHLARSMLGAGVPDDVLQWLVPGGIDQRILDTAREFVLTRTAYDPVVPLFHQMGARSLRDKVKLSWERVFVSRRELAAMYPASRGSRYFLFYYARRLRDVVQTYRFNTRQRSLMRSRGRSRNESLADWLESREPL